MVMTLLTCGNKLVSCGNDLLTCGNKLVFFVVTTF